MSIPTFKAFTGSTLNENDQSIKARQTRNIIRQDKEHEFEIDPSILPVALKNAASYIYSRFDNDFTKITPLTGINIDGIGSGLTAAWYGTNITGLKLRLLSPHFFEIPLHVIKACLL